MSTTTLPSSSKTTASPKQPAAPAATPRTLKVQPYVFFNGRCDEALEYYRRVLGAQVTMLMRFKDAPPSGECGDNHMPAGWADKVMHASVRIGDTEVLASDGCSAGQAEFKGFSLSLDVPNEADAERYYHALADGGQIQMPLAKTFFARRFGAVADRYGVSWMIYVAP